MTRGMSPTRRAILARLLALPRELKPLADVSKKYLRYCSALEADGTALIGHRPWKAPHSYAVRLHPPARDAWFAKYAKAHRVAIPSALRPVLRAANGLSAFGLELYGMAPSMLEGRPHLDRSAEQCLDIATANNDWKHEYKVDRDAFHFGSRELSRNAIGGYFLLRDSTIALVRTSGKLVQAWDDWGTFLADQIGASEAREHSDTPSHWWC
jgi:hypothetical protein